MKVMCSLRDNVCARNLSQDGLESLVRATIPDLSSTALFEKLADPLVQIHHAWEMVRRKWLFEFVKQVDPSSAKILPFHALRKSEEINIPLTKPLQFPQALLENFELFICRDTPYLWRRPLISVVFTMLTAAMAILAHVSDCIIYLVQRNSRRATSYCRLLGKNSPLHSSFVPYI